MGTIIILCYELQTGPEAHDALIGSTSLDYSDNYYYIIIYLNGNNLTTL